MKLKKKRKRSNASRKRKEKKRAERKKMKERIEKRRTSRDEDRRIFFGVLECNSALASLFAGKREREKERYLVVVGTATQQTRCRGVVIFLRHAPSAIDKRVIV